VKKQVEISVHFEVDDGFADPYAETHHQLGELLKGLRDAVTTNGYSMGNFTLVTLEKPNGVTYHDVYITTRDSERKSIFDLPYGYVINCSRTRGWSVWLNETLVTDEFRSTYMPKPWMVIDVAGHVIIDTRTPEEKIPTGG